jgi:hypothetical protein
MIRYWPPLMTILSMPFCLSAQNPTTGPSYTPANLWMTNPVPWSPGNDRVPSAVRQQRDQYFDGLIGLPVPLTPANVKGSGIALGVPLPNQTEIPALPNRAVLIATFSSYQPVLSKSGRAIYTEATFSVSNVFQDATGSIQPGSNIVVILPGGTVTTQGIVLSFLTQRRMYFVAPGRTYLLALSLHSNGTFYGLGKDWDLTSGVVIPDFSASKQVPSTLVGLTLQQLITRLNAQLGIQ